MNTNIKEAIQYYLDDRSESSRLHLKEILSADLDPAEYVEWAVRTEGSVEPVPQRLHRLKTARLLHSAMGMCTGVAELYQNLAKASIDVVNFREELGDAMWYPAVMTHILEIPLESMLLDSSALGVSECRLYLSEGLITDLSARLNQASVAVGEIQDAVRRHVFYGRLLDFERVAENLAVYVQCIQGVGAALGVEFRDMAVTNLTKLVVLFGDKFVGEPTLP